MPTPTPIAISDAVTALNTLGLLPVVAIAAVIGLAVLLYRRFRK